MGSGAFLVEACRQLGKLLTESWRLHGGRPEIPSDQDEETFARRLVAPRCLYGVDRNPIAVDLAKLSLWLATLSKDQPLTFVDHALRAGDSLVGLSKKQIARFHWLSDAEPIQQGFEAAVVGDPVRRVAELRHRIQSAGPDAPDRQLRDWEREAREAAAEVTLYGDLALSAFFDGSRPAARNRKRRELAHAVLAGTAAEFRPLLEARRTADPPFAPLHWEVEFPEVFDRQNPGFDSIVGNPPFAGKNTMANANISAYPHWLKAVHAESHGNSDLVAHFFRRAFSLLRENGTLGLIATNTIAQGDTRSTGLRWICENGGEIYDTRPRVKWPGGATVVVSVVHIHDGAYPGEKRLDDRVVDRITAFLFDRGAHADPLPLEVNADRSFVGSYLLGMGFTFDDRDRKGEASTLATMRQLIARDPKNHEIIFPYIGGEEVNTSPTQAHRRYAINFRDWPLRRADIGERWADADEERRRKLRRAPFAPLDYPDPVAEDWPDLLEIVERSVKPTRAHLTTNAIGRRRAKFWWRYGSSARELYDAIHGIDRVLAIAAVTSHHMFSFLSTNMIFSHKLFLFPYQTFSAFCALQTRPHELWTRFFSSSLGDGLNYAPTDCFLTFPFPSGWDQSPQLAVSGRRYYDHRSRLLTESGLGLTKTYNRFHDPDESDPGILRLRELHDEMDRVVLDAYGWTDVPTACQFILDYETEEQEHGATRRKRPWRYRWPDEVRDEVLARLLALNTERAYGERESSEGAFDGR